MSEPVAIVGMSVLLPGAGSLEDYWRNLVTGVDAITDVPEHRWEPRFYDPSSEHASRVYCRRGGFVDELADFDPLSFNIMPGSVRDTEPDQLLALRVAAAAIDDAGGQDRLPDRDKVGVIIGRLAMAGTGSMRFFNRVMAAEHTFRFLREVLPDLPRETLEKVGNRFDEFFGPYEPESVLGIMSNFAAARIANRLNLRGTSYILDAACASSLIAVDHAVGELMSGRLDAVVAGGVHHNHDISLWSVFGQLKALSREQVIRPFDTRADGLLIGEGTCIVVLKRLSDAIRDHDRIHAVIRGVGVAGDGRGSGLVNPDTKGQALAIRRAWASAGLDPTAPGVLGLLEAHGTATQVGDAAEIATLTEVFGPPQPGPSPVIGSVKSMVGHTLAAAGAAGLIKAALAVSRGVLLPTLHCESPSPKLAASRFRTISSAQPWEGGEPRRAAVNAFGFGGINAHIILEQAPDRPRRRAGVRQPQPQAKDGTAHVREPERILLLSGPDHGAVARLLDADDRVVLALGDTRSPDDRGACRLGIVDPTAARLAGARRIVAAGEPWRGGRDIWFSPRPLLADGKGKIAFVFPGLEADFTPLIADVADHFGLCTAADHFGLCTKDLDSSEYAGHLSSLIHTGLVLTDALARVGVTPDGMAGHSMGEWTAGVAADVVDKATYDDMSVTMLDPVALRDDLMHAVISEGAARMADRLGNYPEVYISHDNAPSQSVICGPAEQVTRLIEECGKQNILCRPLPYATGVHTPYMEPLVQELRAFPDQKSTRAPRVPVWSAVISAPLPDDLDERRELFFRQLVEPVRFRPTMLAMHEAGFRVFLQVGPGALASLIHETLSDLDHLAMPVNVASRSGLAQLERVATALWVEGARVDLDALMAAPSAAPARKERPSRSLRMRLDLGTEIPTLGEHSAGLLGAYPHVAEPTAPAPPAADMGALATLRTFAGGSPAAGELAALLEETAASAVAVLTMAGQPRIVAADSSVITIAVGERIYQIHHRELSNQEDRAS